MLWKTLFLAFAILGEGRGNESLNLAWELIQGFMCIWNHTNQGICVPVPKSSGEGIGFSIVNLNLSKLLESKLHIIISNCTTDCTWGTVKAPFESQYGNIFDLNGTWRMYQDAFYQIPPANWIDLWNKICNRWNISEPVTPILDLPFKSPVPPCPEDLMNIHNTSGKWWSQTHSVNPDRLSCTTTLNCTLGAAGKCPVARTQLWLPGEKRMTAVEVAPSPYKGHILGFDMLAGRR